jgi:signal transduction histidine kinase
MRCDNIILQLLDFARSQKPQTTAIDVDSLVEHTLNEEATKLPAKLTITCDLGLQGSKAYVDGERTTRAIINLVYNAAEAMMNNGEPRPEMGGRVPNINVSTHLTARGTEILITDNGPGISSEVLEKIREPLFTTKGFGTGLGIPAVEKIMELHGGGLEISSVLGEGSRFTIWFPATRQNQQAA